MDFKYCDITAFYTVEHCGIKMKQSYQTTEINKMSQYCIIKERRYMINCKHEYMKLKSKLAL